MIEFGVNTWFLDLRTRILRRPSTCLTLNKMYEMFKLKLNIVLVAVFVAMIGDVQRSKFLLWCDTVSEGLSRDLFCSPRYRLVVYRTSGVDIAYFQRKVSHERTRHDDGNQSYSTATADDFPIDAGTDTISGGRVHAQCSH